MSAEWTWRRLTAVMRMQPNYLIIGAQRCGTTSLYIYLVQHPDVKPCFMKETHYFDKKSSRSITWYQSFFPLKNGSPASKRMEKRAITGEATPYYLFDPLVPERVYRKLPDVRLIILLRDPVERAYSHYQMNKRSGVEKRPFRVCVEQEMKELENRQNPGWSTAHKTRDQIAFHSYLVRGIYIDQIKRWRKWFLEDQFLVLKSEAFYQDPEKSLKRVSQFLALPDDWPDHYQAYNAASYPPMPGDLKSKLEAFYLPHNRRLYQIIGEDYQWNSGNIS
jgi:hypothetical protein